MELRRELATFLRGEGKDSLAETFNNSDSLAKIAYLSDIYSHLNELNLNMKGGKKFFRDEVDSLYFFNQNLQLIKRAPTENDFSPLTILTVVLRETGPSGGLPFVVKHLTALLEGFSK